MARRITPSQFQSMVRQAEQRQRQAINDYNNAIRRRNTEVRRAVSEYNRRIGAHNAQVRTNRQRLQAELARLASRSTSRRYITYEVSVQSLHTSLSHVDATSWGSSAHLYDLAQGEAANSVAVLNALDGPEFGGQEGPTALPENGIARELEDFPRDLKLRWNGALFALDPRNPDAARHFCTSSREILAAILDTEAPDTAVFAADPSAPVTATGRPTRRARIQYCLRRRGRDMGSLSDFIDQDIANVIDLFQTFNDGTHGSAGRFDPGQLMIVKQRVEDAVRFLHAAIRG